jgi:hypothetical protein
MDRGPACSTRHPTSNTVSDIENQVRAGEDSHAEFKEIRFGERSVTSPNTEDMAGEMVAFANGDGGALFGDELRLTIWGAPGP